MTKITQNLILKKSEHHDGLLADLQEISLHQLNIEKIELLGNICKKLRILYLQNNLIGKIENIHKLKELRYLNLALNNITKIENISGCEKLERLDLTVNFIPLEHLEESIYNLQDLIFFEDLYLVGNPCTDWPLYRPFVLSCLPKLKRLDGKDVTRVEREEASRDHARLLSELRLEVARRNDMAAQCTAAGESPPPSSAFTPAARLALYREEQAAEVRKQAERTAASAASPFNPAPDLAQAAYARLHAREEPRPDGTRPSQRNTGKYAFTLQTSHDGAELVLSVAVPRFLDTSALSIDVHPTWVQCIIKGKNLLLHLDEEVLASAARVQRILSTGALVITMPRVAATRGIVNLADGHLDTNTRTFTPTHTDARVLTPAVATDPVTAPATGGPRGLCGLPHTEGGVAAARDTDTELVQVRCRHNASLGRQRAPDTAKGVDLPCLLGGDVLDATAGGHMQPQTADARGPRHGERARAADMASAASLAATLGVDLDELPPLE